MCVFWRILPFWKMVLSVPSSDFHKHFPSLLSPPPSCHTLPSRNYHCMYHLPPIKTRPRILIDMCLPGIYFSHHGYIFPRADFNSNFARVCRFFFSNLSWGVFPIRDKLRFYSPCIIMGWSPPPLPSPTRTHSHVCIPIFPNRICVCVLPIWVKYQLVFLIWKYMYFI